NIFIPLGVLTKARREAVDILLQKVLHGHERERKDPDLAEIETVCCQSGDGAGLVCTAPVADENMENNAEHPLLAVEVTDISSLMSTAGAGADIAYIPIEHFRALTGPDYEGAVRKLANTGITIVFILPQITHDQELTALIPLIKDVKDSGFAVACSSFGTVQLASELELSFTAQKELTTFNSVAACALYRAGAHRVTLSSELNLDEITDVCDALKDSKTRGQVEIVIHGRELLLVTEHDLIGSLVEEGLVNRDSDVNLVDNKERKYPVKCWGQRTLIYDSKVLNMLDHVERLKECGADVLRLDLSLYSKNEVRKITRAYKKALVGKDVRLRDIRDEMYCEGHYFKGVG
ncbi:MAG: U32 family peptidase, partial [Euryarchaeota archaeon]|nr:U32 family peptidase [Euryarchaeota archaeon]